MLTPAGQQILARYGFITVTDPSALSPYQLLIAGNLTTPLTLTAELIENYEQQQVEFNGQSYRGLGFGQLLMQIQPKSNARTFSLLSSDGSQTVLAIADLTADPRAIIAAEADGSFTSIIPSNPNASQLKNIVKITVE